MNKTIKSLLLFAAVAMAITSCSRPEPEMPADSGKGAYTYLFNLSQAGTKALIGDDSIEYESADALGVFAGATVNSKSQVDVTTTPVTVGVKATAALQAGDMVYAYYPYSAENASAQATSVTLNIPVVQSQNGTSYDADAMPMVSLPCPVEGAVQAGATESVGNLYMNNLGAVAQFNIYGASYASETIQSVSFLSENLAGDFTFDLTAVADEDDLAIEGADAALVKTNVSNTLSVGASEAAGSKVYMVLTPGEHKGVLTITTSAASYTYDLETAIRFNRSKVRPVNVNLANALRTKIDVISALEAAGYDHRYYVPLEMDYTNYAYYKSDNSKYGSGLCTDQSNCVRFVATRIFEKSEIPSGSVIVCLDNYQYRPEWWTSLDAVNSSRPGNVTDNVVEVDEAWWDGWNYRGFNLSYVTTTNLDDAKALAMQQSFAIFVPKLDPSAASLTDIISAAGYNPSDYTQIEIDYTDFAYYQSNTDYISDLRTIDSDGWNGTIADFVATRIFSRSDLPDGTLIVQKGGHQYRPEGWVALDQKNSSRPDNVSTGVVQINDSWWGTFNYRGFNLALNPRVDLAASADATETRCQEVRDGFGIFVPKQPVEIKSIRILAIGNSFSMDALQYLYGMLKDVGYTDITLGNIYKGGCTLETHADYFTNNTAGYTYYQNTTGSWTSTSSSAPIAPLQSQDWDYITMQQGSPVSGQADTFDPYLATLVGVVKSNCPDAQLVWHMTWAYQANSSHSGFANYGNDQMTMYNAIVSAVRSKILTNSNFVKVIPNGTAVQNMRTSYVGDTITRDGHHMSYDIGRYLTALTYAKVLTGCDLADVTYTPSDQTYTSEAIAAMKDAVNKAVATPYAVTQSAYPPQDDFDYAAATVEQILSHDGYDPSAYSKLDLTFTNYAYWNSTSEKLGGVYSEKYSAANESIHGYTNYKEFICTQIIPKSSIPAGSVIVVKGGCKYRPEGWVSLGAKASSRPAEVTSNHTVLVNDAWWGSLNYRGFNVAFNPRVVLNDTTCGQLQQSFAIYVPKK